MCIAASAWHSGGSVTSCGSLQFLDQRVAILLRAPHQRLAGLKGHPALAAVRRGACNVAMSTQPMSREMAAIARAVRIGFWTAVVVGVLWILLDPPAGQDVSRWTGGLLVGFLAGIVATAVALIPSWVRQFLGWSLDE